VAGDEETTKQAFERGHREGGVDALLAEHGQHLKQIHGSMDRVGDELADLKTAYVKASGEFLSALAQLEIRFNASIQELKAQRAADAATATTTARALESERKLRVERSAASWTPMQRLLAIAVGAGAIVGIITTILALTRPHP
jgi:hypothetical protein